MGLDARCATRSATPDSHLALPLLFLNLITITSTTGLMLGTVRPTLQARRRTQGRYSRPRPFRQFAAVNEQRLISSFSTQCLGD